MHAPARPALDCELLNTLGVSDRRHIRRRVCDPSSGLPIGAAVAGPVIGDQPHAERAQQIFKAQLEAAAIEQPTPWCPVQGEDRRSARLSPLCEAEGSALRRSYGPRRPLHMVRLGQLIHAEKFLLRLAGSATLGSARARHP
jgi:hypothetical protein